MAIDLGKFDKQKNYGRGISLGVFDKIPEDLDYDAFKREYLEREKRSIGESVWEWADAFPTGVDQMIDSAKESMTNKSVVGGMFNFADYEEMKDAWKTVGMTAKIGLADEWHTYRAIKNNIANELSSSSQDDKIRKAYELRKFRENYFNVDRENMLSEVPKEFRADADFGADFLTPTNLLPAFFGKKVMDKPVRASIKGSVKGVSLVAKGAEKLSEGVEKGLGYPTKKLDELMPKGGIAYRGAQMIALASDTGIGTFFGSMVFVEGLAKVAKKTSREISEVSRVFAQPSSHARFLYRLSTDEAVSASTRKLAARMYKLRGTRAYDVLFDGLVAGLSSSAVQSAMEFAQGSSAEEMGQASGAGFVLGTPVGMAGGSRNSGKADEDRSDLSINNYLEKKANQQNQDTVKALKKLDRDTLISLSTMDEFAELGDYNMQLMDHKNFKEKILGEDESVDSKNLPAASYNQETKVILLDESKLKEGTEKARKIVMHEIGHAYMREMLGSNPLMRRKILEKFEDENGREYFFTDLDGVKNGSIKVNKQAENFMREYALLMGVEPKDFAKSKYADNAFLLAEEIGAEQFSALMRETPNVFKRYEKSFRHSLLNAGKDVLSKLGIIDADSGNLIDSPISASLRKNKDVQNLFTNYMQARNDHYRMRADDIEKGRKHEPRKGQDSADRFTELFGGHGINIGIGAHFSVKDRQMFDELIKAAELDAQGADSDLTGIGKNFEGKRLGAKTKDIFRKAGANGGGAMNIIDFFQNVIDTRSMIKFGYRSAKWWDRSHYNPFYERSFSAIGWQISPKKPTTRMGRTVYPNLKIVGYDADLIMSNAELLSQAGFLKGKYKNTEEFLNAFAEHAESLLQQTGEKRINPLGQGENELFVAALGRIAGEKFIPKIQDPELSDFFTDPNSKLKQAYRSYDVGAMAGVTSLNKKGLAFNYNNAKHNYMPSLSGAGSEGSTIPRTLYMPNNNKSLSIEKMQNNLLDVVLPNIKQEKFTPEQLRSEVNKNRGTAEFLEDIGITEKILEEIKVGKTISKSALDFLVRANQKVIDFDVVHSRKMGAPLYEGYLERGYYTNYDEITFSLPRTEMYELGDVTGGHWQDDRILFHIRKSDRILPNGDTSYHIEEIQSDWHQHAKRAGYRDEKATENIKEGLRAGEVMKEREKVVKEEGNKQLIEFALRNTDLIKNTKLYLRDMYGDYYDENPNTEEESIRRIISRIAKPLEETNDYGQNLKYNLIKEQMNGVRSHFKARADHESKRTKALALYEEGFFRKGEMTEKEKSYLKRVGADEYEYQYDNNSHWRNMDNIYKNLSEDEAFERRILDKNIAEQTGIDIAALDMYKDNVIYKIKTDPTYVLAKVKYDEAVAKKGNLQSNAPLKKSWHSRGLAEAIMDAWSKGKQHLTWVTGERSAEQNNLDQYFSSVSVLKLKKGGHSYDELGNAVPNSDDEYKVIATQKNGAVKRRNVADDAELARFIGKDAAKYASEKLKKQHSVEVVDVKKPHEGRRIFYDKMIVSEAKRFAKIMGTRPPIKSKILLDQPLLKDQELVKLDLPASDPMGVEPPREQEVWYMELPKDKPVLPLYMPTAKPQGDGSTKPKILGDQTDYVFSPHARDLWTDPQQAISSSKTSINSKKLPTGYNDLLRKNIFKKGQVVVDIGGGKFDNAVERLKKLGAKLYIYDPFNRTQEHNYNTAKAVADGGADVAVSNNTLNVIAEKENIHRVIAQTHNALRDGSKAYFTVFEGDRSSEGKVTTAGYQRNEPTESYMNAVRKVFGDNVVRNGKIITATKQPVKLDPQDILFKRPHDKEVEVTHGHVPPVIKIADDSMPLYIPDFLVGKTVFPIMGDRLMVGMYTARSGNTFECRGGHNHPLVDEYKKQVAWACGQSGSETMGRVEQGLLSAINASDGYAVTILMNEDAVASNRTYARILLDELTYDAYHVKGGKKIVEKHIKSAVRKWREAIINKAKKKKQTVPQAVLDADFRTIDDLKESLPTMNFEHRKELVSKVMSNDYKKEIASVAGKGYKAINWIDLYNSMIEFPKSEGYRTGDMIHVLKFDKSNPIINLSEIGASPDPTYDVSFRGNLVHSFEGRVSAFDFFKKGLDYFAYDQDYLSSAKKVASSDRTLKKDRSVGSRANRMIQLKYDDPVFKTKMSKKNTMPPQKPIKFKKGTKAENRYLEERNTLNAKIRKRKLAELKE